jgi:hypothetical protein
LVADGFIETVLMFHGALHAAWQSHHRAAADPSFVTLLSSFLDEIFKSLWKT